MTGTPGMDCKDVVEELIECYIRFNLRQSDFYKKENCEAWHNDERETMKFITAFLEECRKNKEMD